ncbi:unnamed protein product [Cuscuta epithymum]|jgi:hypothetical protein
MGVF